MSNIKLKEALTKLNFINSIRLESCTGDSGKVTLHKGLVKITTQMEGIMRAPLRMEFLMVSVGLSTLMEISMRDK